MSDNGEWQGDEDLLSDFKEKKLIFSVLDSFRSYRRIAHFNITHVRRQNFYALPSRHQNYLSAPPVSMLDTFCQIDDAIDRNAALAEEIMAVGATSLGLRVSEDGEDEWAGSATKLDLDKCRSTLNQLYRDWSAGGAIERETCYGPILRDMQELVPTTQQYRRVLVPGAGLGRLVFELCLAGYSVEGNEISYHQLFTSSYILNATTSANQHILHPFIHSFSNHHTRASQLKSVQVPDVCPSATLTGQNVGSMSMTTGDFCVLYCSPEYESTFDVVATVFFIDTAPNLLRYVETVRHCLRLGGLWMNLGPLLWHFESRAHDHSQEGRDEEMGRDGDGDRGIADPGSFELSQDEVVVLLRDHGFEIVKHETSVGETGYIQDPASMLQNVYRPVHWVARKR